ncbi:hypothetical protein LSCM1_02017 [Leishmania martiniquensis]|uniref:Uncharacterized protein n=1 Tax=Leishmania martiniquensis TaxID=1580590 RepID=A0A836KM42_9TRYP|nr:hypothetical protein LSCM1_02017 [Leishmania martiniquensis]
MHTALNFLSRAMMPPPRSYALDLEYLKFNGKSYVRSLALVPFARVGVRSPRQPRATEVVVRRGSPDGSGVELPPSVLTDLGSAPTVLELDPREVMRVSEPLPCGYLLRPKIQQALVQGAALEELRAPLEMEARSAMEAFASLRQALREQQKRASREEKGPPTSAGLRCDESASHPTHAAAESVDVGSDFLDLESGKTSTLSAVSSTADAEQVAMGELQIRLGMARFFKGLDPFGIPNVRRFSREALELLYAAPAESRDFIEASMHISGLRAYSKGRQGYKPLACLSHYHPRLLQAVLRRSFESAAAWYRWLEDCATCVEAHLLEVRNAHRDGVYVDTRRRARLSTGGASAGFDCLEAASAPTRRPLPLDFKESLTMEDLAKQMLHMWRDLELSPQSHSSGSDGAAQGSRAKVYVYGSSDAAVLHRTLRLALSAAPRTGHLSERLIEGGCRLCRPRQLPDAVTIVQISASASAHVAPSPSDLLQSPLEAVVVDATRHPLFTAAGFASSPKKPPSLMTALEKAANSDATAAELLLSPQWHDPLWDAQALACVCACAGMARASDERRRGG